MESIWEQISVGSTIHLMKDNFNIGIDEFRTLMVRSLAYPDQTLPGFPPISTLVKLFGMPMSSAQKIFNETKKCLRKSTDPHPNSQMARTNLFYTQPKKSKQFPKHKEHDNAEDSPFGCRKGSVVDEPGRGGGSESALRYSTRSEYQMEYRRVLDKRYHLALEEFESRHLGELSGYHPKRESWKSNRKL